MKLNQIANNPGAHKHKHKVGRGSSSGLGKTSGRGVKGAKARTGNQVHGFEGGQMPLHMRMPKRGFRNIFGTDFAEVNISRIQKAIDNKKLDIKAKITEEVLRKAGLAHKSRDGVRLLGKGAITAKIDIEVAGASAARQGSGRKGRRQRHHDLYQEGLHQQEGRAGQAPDAPRRSGQEARSPQGIISDRPARKGGAAPHIGPEFRDGTDAYHRRVSGSSLMASAAEQLAANFNFGSIWPRPRSCAAASSSRWAR